MHARALILSAAAAMALAALAAPLSAHAQGALKPVDALVINPPSHPVPVTGTVRLDGGVGAITGTLKSGDKNLTAYEQFVSVNTTSFGNHSTGQIDVSDFKEVRVSFSLSSCSQCSAIEVAVSGVTAGGKVFQIDQFVAYNPAPGAPDFASRTYSVPGSKLYVSLRALQSGSQASMLVAIIGRAN